MPVGHGKPGDGTRRHDPQLASKKIDKEKPTGKLADTD